MGGDERPMATHYDSLKAYVEYARKVKSCPDCNSQVKTNTQAAEPPHLPYYGFSSDWLEWRPNQINLASVGSLSASMHFILDLETLRDFAIILNKTNDIQKYTALATAYRKQFNELYLTTNTSTPAQRSYCPPAYLQGDKAPRTCHTQ